MAKLTGVSKVVRSDRAKMIDAWFKEESKEANKTESSYKVHLLVTARAKRLKMSIPDVYAMLPKSVKGKSGISFSEKLAEFDAQIKAVANMPNVVQTIMAQRHSAIMVHARICKVSECVDVCVNAKREMETRKAKKASDVVSKSA